MRAQVTNAAFAVLLVAAAEPAFAETRIGFYLGISFHHRSDLRIRSDDGSTDVRYRGTSWASRSLEFPLYYGIRVTHLLAKPSLGIAIDFFHDKAYARVGAPVVEGGDPPNATIERFNLSHGLNYLLLNLVYQFDTAWPSSKRLRSYVAGGAGILLPHVEATITGQSVDAYQLGGVGAQLTAGGTLDLFSRIAIAAEYKLTEAAISVDVPGAKVGTRLISHHLVAGPELRLPFP